VRVTEGALKIIDLRSDTVTRPSPGMRQAMATAEVGDDVYGEDPTVRSLEARAAELTGKQAALFVPSGTMANQIALRVLCGPGEVVLAGEGAHVLAYEAGAAAALWGLQIETIGRGGLFTVAELLAALPPDDVHCAPATLVCLENTHNGAGGRAWPLEAAEEVVAAARSRGLRAHLDGARLFNAAHASGVPAARLAAPFDTVAFCLSKGLGAPVGSLLCGDADRIERGRRIRKMLGGGMRQVGVLAAAGLYALEHNVERLALDHAHAKRLAQGLEKLGIAVEPAPETNIVMFRVPDAGKFVHAAQARGVLVAPYDAQRLRAVTHLDVSGEDVEEALERIAEVVPPR
jgi:threonine aldolase